MQTIIITPLKTFLHTFGLHHTSDTRNCGLHFLPLPLFWALLFGASASAKLFAYRCLVVEREFSYAFWFGNQFRSMLTHYSGASTCSCTADDSQEIGFRCCTVVSLHLFDGTRHLVGHKIHRKSNSFCRPYIVGAYRLCVRKKRSILILLNIRYNKDLVGLQSKDN